MTNASLLLAGLLTLGIGIVHSWLGERRLIGPLLAPDRRAGLLEKSAFARRTLRFAWHLTTLAWWGMAAILVAYSRMPIDPGARFVLLIIATTFLLTGVAILIVSRGRHLGGPVFLAIAGLCSIPVL